MLITLDLCPQCRRFSESLQCMFSLCAPAKEAGIAVTMCIFVSEVMLRFSNTLLSACLCCITCKLQMPCTQ